MCWLTDLLKQTKTETIKPCGIISIHLMASILLDKLEEMGCQADILLPVMHGLPDMDMKIYRKEDVKNCSKLKEISKLKYIPEEHDCDDFAAKLFGEYAGLVWTNIHSLNWFVDENSLSFPAGMKLSDTFWFIEPQTRKLAKDLEDWQGWKIRFFIGR